MFTISNKRRRGLRDAARRTVAGLVALSMTLGNTKAVLAQSLIVDPSAPGSSFLGSSGGVPVVNIGTPLGGVSVNKFSDFNVSASGLILNNAPDGATTVIGAGVTANPNLMVSGPANVIINEVTGLARSTMTGTTEVAGATAHVIVANPNGIVCNGCAFLNATSSTLTTARPWVSDTGVVRLPVKEGEITIGPNGFAPGAQGAVLGRHVRVDGPIVTTDDGPFQSVLVAGGSHKFFYNQSNFHTSEIHKIAPETARTSPFAVDISESGIISSGKVVVRGMEDNLGINVYGDVEASKWVTVMGLGDVFVGNITSPGKVWLNGLDVRQYGDIATDTVVQVNANSFTIYDGRNLAAGGNVAINAAEFVVVAGEVSGANIDINVATGTFTNNGFIFADDALTVIAGEDILQKRDIATEYDVAIDPALQKYLQAYQLQLLEGGEIADIAAEMLARAGAHEEIAQYVRQGATMAAVDLTLDAQGDIVNTGGAMAATHDATLTSAGNIINEYLAITSKLRAEDGCPDENCGSRTDFHPGEMLAGNDLTLTAANGFVRNTASDMAAGQNISIVAGLDVSNTLLTSQHAVDDEVDDNVVTEKMVTANYCEEVGKNTQCHSATSLVKSTTYRKIYTFDEVNIIAPGRISTLDGDISIASGGDFTSLGSKISAGGDVSVVAGGKGVLDSFIDKEEDFIRVNTAVGREVCGGKDDAYCGTVYHWVPVTTEGDVLRTATTDILGRNISIVTQDDLVMTGVRLLAPEGVSLTSTEGSILIDSTDLPDHIQLDDANGAAFVELEADVIQQIFRLDDQNKNLTGGFVALLRDNDLLTATEALRRATSVEDLKPAARDVGARTRLSLIDGEYLQVLRAEAEAAEQAAVESGDVVQIEAAAAAAEALRLHEAELSALSGKFMSAGSVHEGAGSLAEALTEQAFPELALVQDLALDANGLAVNSRSGEVERTRTVTETRNTGYWDEQTVIVSEAYQVRHCCEGKNDNSWYTTEYRDVERVNQVWVSTGPKDVLIEETYLVTETATAPLISGDAAEQTAFVNAVAWRFGSHDALSKLENSGRSMVYGETTTEVSAAKDVYVIGATQLTSGGDLSVDAGRRIGVLGAVNTNLRLETATLPTGAYEQQTITVTEDYRVTHCCEGKNDSSWTTIEQRDVQKVVDVFVPDGGSQDFELAYESFIGVGENLQLGTLMRDAYVDETAAGATAIDYVEGGLAYAQQTSNYTLSNASIVAGGMLSLNAGEDVLNFGGSVVSGEDMFVTAAVDVRNEALRRNFTLTAEDGCVSRACGGMGQDYRSGEFLSGSGMIVSAGRDVRNFGAVMSAAGSLLVQAEQDIVAEAITSQYLYYFAKKSSLFSYQKKRLYRAIIEEGVFATEFGDAQLIAGRDVTIDGSIISSGTGIDIQAGRDVKLLARSEELNNYYKNRGFSGLSYGSETTLWNEFGTAFAKLEGGDVAIYAERDVLGMGAQVFASGNIDAYAGEDLTFDAHQNLRYTETSGWSFGISFGGSAIIEAALTGEDVFEAYVASNPTLAAVHQLATAKGKWDTVNGILNLGYHLPALGSAINKGAAGGPTSIADSLVNQLNPFGWMAENGVFSTPAPTPPVSGGDPGAGGPAGADDAAGASGHMMALLDGIEFRFSAYRSRQEWTESHVSQLVAGGNLWLEADKDLSLVGGTIASAQGVNSLWAGENLLVAALSDTTRSTSSNWGASVGFKEGSVTFGGSYSRSTGSSRMYTNAALTAGEGLYLHSGLDTALLGTNLAAASIDIYAGQDLIVQSRQNTSESESFGFNFSISISTAGVPIGLGFGANGSEADRTYTDTPTTIVAQDELNIYTGRTTFLLGAGIWSKTDDLTLDTGQFIYDNFNDSDQSSSWSFSVSTNFSSLSASGSASYSNVQGITFATLGEGELTVRDVGNFEIAGLNTDPGNMQRITSDTSFALEIPGINLSAWVEQVKDTINLLEAVTTRIPDSVRSKGGAAVKLFQDLVLQGIDPDELRILASSREFAAAVKAQANYLDAFEFYRSEEGIPENVKRAIAIGYTVLLGELSSYESGSVVVPCLTNGTKCEVTLDKLEEILANIPAEKLVEGLESTFGPWWLLGQSWHTGYIDSGVNGMQLTSMLKTLLNCALEQPDVFLELTRNVKAGPLLRSFGSHIGTGEEAFFIIASAIDDNQSREEIALTFKKNLNYSYRLKSVAGASIDETFDATLDSLIFSASMAGINGEEDQKETIEASALVLEYLRDHPDEVAEGVLSSATEFGQAIWNGDPDALGALAGGAFLALVPGGVAANALRGTRFASKLEVPGDREKWLGEYSQWHELRERPRPTIRDHYSHHNEMRTDVVDQLEERGYRVADGEASFGDSCGVGRCRPDILYSAPDGTMGIFEIKTGNADLSIRQTEIFPQIENGDAIPRGLVAKRFGLRPGVPLRDQGYPNGIPIEVLNFPGAGQ